MGKSNDLYLNVLLLFIFLARKKQHHKEKRNIRLTRNDSYKDKLTI